jgi:hypothetical protein
VVFTKFIYLIDISLYDIHVTKIRNFLHKDFCVGLHPTHLSI